MTIISVLTNFIYLEIIEIKFCGLNKYIKKNISKRGIFEKEKIIKDILESELSFQN